MVLSGDLGLPAVFDHHRLVWLYDDRGTGDLVAGSELFAREYAGVMPGTAGKETCPPGGRRQSGVCDLVRRLSEFRAAADRFDRNRFQHHLPLGIAKAETLAVMGVKPQLHAVGFLEVTENVPV